MEQYGVIPTCSWWVTWIHSTSSINKIWTCIYEKLYMLLVDRSSNSHSSLFFFFLVHLNNTQTICWNFPKFIANIQCKNDWLNIFDSYNSWYGWSEKKAEKGNICSWTPIVLLSKSAGKHEYIISIQCNSTHFRTAFILSIAFDLICSSL